MNLVQCIILRHSVCNKKASNNFVLPSARSWQRHLWHSLPSGIGDPVKGSNVSFRSQLVNDGSLRYCEWSLVVSEMAFVHTHQERQLVNLVLEKFCTSDCLMEVAWLLPRVAPGAVSKWVSL